MIIYVIDKLRQTFLMEQFLQTVSSDLKIRLVDQKPKTVDEMARLADQYVAIRKQSHVREREQHFLQPKFTEILVICQHFISLQINRRHKN